jgi:hypothetical protein
MVLDEILAIPADATIVTIQGIEMKIISTEQAEVLLIGDAIDDKIHECILKNGRFLFESENGKLKTLYKVEIQGHHLMLFFYAYK